MARPLSAQQIDESQHRVSWASRGSQIRQKKQTNHVSIRHDTCHRDAEAGVQFSNAGKSVVWDDVRRLLVSKDAEGKLMTIGPRQAEARRRLVAVKPMTKDRVCSGPDRAFEYKIESTRSYHLSARPRDGTS